MWHSVKHLIRANALLAFALGGLLLLGSWDALYQVLSLPQARPALVYQVGGGLIIALAYLLWSASSSAQLAQPAARACVLGTGIGALVLCAWLVSGRLSVVPRTQILAVVGAGGLVLLTAAMGLAVRRAATDVPARRRPRRRQLRWPAPFALLARGVPSLSAEGLGFFRIALGMGLIYAVVRYTQTEVKEGGNYGVLNSLASVDALAANTSAVNAIKAITLVALVLFTVGLLTRAAYALAVLGIVALVVVSLEDGGAHDWGPPIVAMLVMTVVRWGDGVSVDAAIRRLRNRGSPRPPDHSYGLAIWLPGFMLGLGFLAAAWAKIAVNGGFAWALTGAVQYHWVEDAANAPVDWGLWIAQHEWLAVLFAIGGLVIETTFILHAFSRSDLVRGLFGLLGVSLLLGFMLFQGVFWLQWWLLLAALLPWQRMTDAVIGLLPVQVVLVDRTCPLCRRTARVLHAVDVFNRLHFADANDSASRRRYAQGISVAGVLTDIHVADLDAGTVREGYDGYVLLARSVPTLWPLALLGPLPGLRQAGRWIYMRIAAARGHDHPCSDEVCVRPGAAAAYSGLPNPQRSRPVPTLHFGMTTSIVLAAVLAVQAYASAARVEHEPFITNFPMYSGTYPSRAAFADQQRNSLSDPRFATVRDGKWVDVTGRIEELGAASSLVKAAEQAEGDLLNARDAGKAPEAEVLEEALQPVEEVREQYAERYGQALGPLQVAGVSRPFLWERGEFGPEQRVPLMTFTEDDVELASR